MRSKLGFSLLCGAIVALHLWSLMRYPFFFVDEVWMLSKAWSFKHTFRAFGGLDVGFWDRFDGHWTIFPWLVTVIQSVSQLGLAEPSLFTLRLMSLSFGLLLLIEVYSIGAYLQGVLAARLSVLVVAFSFPFIYSAHMGRYDVITAVFGYGALSCYFYSQKPRIRSGILTGLLAALAVEVHPHGAIFAPAIASLYLVRLRWGLLRDRNFLGFMLGGILGALCYFLLHLARYPETFWLVNRLAFSETHAPPITAMDPMVLLNSLATKLRTIVNYSAMFPIIAIAISFFLLNKDPKGKVILVFCSALFLAYTLLVRNSSIFYWILITPAFELLIVSLIVVLLGRFKQGEPRLSRVSKITVLLLSIMLFLLTFQSNVRQLRANAAERYERMSAQLLPLIPDDNSSIIGPQTYWLDLHEHRYYSWEILVFYQKYVENSSLEDAFLEFKPDILIIDEHLQYFITDNPENSFLEELHLRKTDLNMLLSKYAQLRGTVQVDAVTLSVYQFVWPDD